jgi:hypothetical protein
MGKIDKFGNKFLESYFNMFQLESLNNQVIYTFFRIDSG